jgi:hypothetical protein
MTISNGARISMEATAARYDDADVLRISGRLKLFCDAASRGHDIPTHCSNCDL